MNNHILSETEITEICSEAIKKLANGEVDKDLFTIAKDEIASSEIKELLLNTKHLVQKYSEGKEFINELAKGQLETEPPVKNLFASPYKELYSSLKHFIHQLTQVAEGNYNVKVDFRGKFSETFNYLTTSLIEKKKLEQQLAESEEKFRTIINTSPDGISITTTEGELLYASNNLLKMFGYSSFDEVKNLNMFDPLTASEKEKARNSVDFILKNGKSTGAKEYTETRKDGTPFSCEIHGGVVKDNQENPSFLFFIHRDISERLQHRIEIQKYAEELEKSNAAKDKFFSIIAHDLRGPFQGFLGLSDLLANAFETLTEEEIKTFSSGLHTSLKNQYELLTDLLEWSKMHLAGSDLELETLSLNNETDKLISTLSFIANPKGIRLINDISDKITITADKKMLRLILRNLISNAIKFTFRDGTIIVSAGRSEKFVVIKVTDTGTGISKENIEKLFRIDVRHTTKGTADEQGTGLGLVLCKEMVEKHGGAIWIESEVGKGSCFCFTMKVDSEN